MWNIAIVEDEDASRDVLIRYLHQYEKEHNLALTLHTFPDGLRFLEGYQCDYSIVFLDIEMPFLSGMETAKRLRALDDAVCLVFVTNVAQYAVEGYTVQAAGYLLKPVAYYQFSVMLEKLMLTLDRRERSELLLPVSGGMERVDVAAVLYVEVEEAISFYDSILKTGSDGLDAILGEKRLICEKAKIRLNYMGDGSALNILRDVDIYTLIGNALDNAIESVRSIDDVEKRFILFEVKNKAGMAVIHMENCCGTPLQFRDGRLRMHQAAGESVCDCLLHPHLG
ncbi:MAG: response regulator [Clostridiales bacterium]|nr:response regulator [Clostridiales bacterium]